MIEKHQFVFLYLLLGQTLKHYILGALVKIYRTYFTKIWVHLHTFHGGFLEGVYEIELDTKTEYEGF
jgi:hypothetical protein